MSEFSETSTQKPPSPSPQKGLSWLSESGKLTVSSREWVMFLIPILLLTLIWVSFWISPKFYFTYVLERNNREFQIVEILTFLCGALAGMGLGYVSYQLRALHYWQAAIWVGSRALGTIFFAGEEISWGQSYWGWETPSWWRENISRETNFHNTQEGNTNRLQSTHLGIFFLLVMLVIAPLLWSYLCHKGLSLNLAPAMPDFASAGTIVVALLYRESKDILKSWFLSGTMDKGFLWGMSEHREMLVAVGLLIYAISRWQVLKRYCPRNEN